MTRLWVAFCGYKQFMNSFIRPLNWVHSRKPKANDVIMYYAIVCEIIIIYVFII